MSLLHPTNDYVDNVPNELYACQEHCCAIAQAECELCTIRSASTCILLGGSVVSQGLPEWSIHDPNDFSRHEMVYDEDMSNLSFQWHQEAIQDIRYVLEGDL